MTAAQAAERDLEFSMDLAAASPSVTWLSSSMCTDALAEAVHERTHARLPDNYPVLLRCFDPRVLPELHKALAAQDQAGQKAYWCLDGAWLYLNRFMQLETLPLLPLVSEATFEPPLSLNQSQVDMLLAAAEVDQVMPELIKASPEAFLALPPEQRSSFTRDALVMADGYELASLADRVTFCLLGLELGTEFHRKGQWAELLSQVRMGRLRLIDAIERANYE